MALYKQPRSPFYWYDFTFEGSRYRGSTKTTGLTRARAFESDMILSLRQKVPDYFRPGKSPTLGELMPRFAEFVENSRIEPNSKRYYAYGSRLLRNSQLAGMKIDIITNDAVESIDFQGEAGKCSPHYRNQALRTLKRMLAKAVEWNLIKACPKLKLEKAYGRDVMIDAETELRLFYAASQPLRDVLIIMMDTGMRPSEVFPMRWENVFWADRRIFIPKSKTEKGRRYVPMSARMMDMLLVRATGLKEGWVFPSDSKQGHLTTIAKAFQSARRRAGIDARIVPYSARHTFGTFTMKHTGNLPGVMSAMGHADVRSTLPYQHHGIDDIRTAIDQRNAEPSHTLRHTDSQVN